MHQSSLASSYHDIVANFVCIIVSFIVCDLTGVIVSTIANLIAWFIVSSIANFIVCDFSSHSQICVPLGYLINSFNFRFPSLPAAGLNLGSLLNRRQGFDRLGTEEGELESLSQDLSDAEYEATGETTELNT